MPSKDSRFSSGRDRLRKAAKESTQRGSSCYTVPDGFEFFRPKVGIISFDIMPYIVGEFPQIESSARPGEPWYRRRFRQHSNIGPEKKTIVCPTTFGKPCPICKFRAEHKDTGDIDEKVLDSYKWKFRDLYLLTLQDKETQGKRVIMDMSPYCFSNILDEEILAIPDGSEDDWMLDFWLPDCGATISARFREATGDKYKYVECGRVDIKDRRKQYKPDIVDEMPVLDELLTQMSYDAIYDLFMEMDGPEDEGEQPSRSHRRSDPEPEEEPERPARGSRRQPDPDPEPEEKPARGGRRRPEPEKEPEDTAEEKPARGRRRPEPEADPDPDAEGGREGAKSTATGTRRRGTTNDAPAEEKPARGARGGKAAPEDEPPAADDDGDPVCPHDLAYGKDTDSDEACMTCDVWDGCLKAKEDAAAPRRRRG